MRNNGKIQKKINSKSKLNVEGPKLLLIYEFALLEFDILERNVGKSHASKRNKNFFFFLESNMMQNLMYWIPILL